MRVLLPLQETRTLSQALSQRERGRLTGGRRVRRKSAHEVARDAPTGRDRHGFCTPHRASRPQGVSAPGIGIYPSLSEVAMKRVLAGMIGVGLVVGPALAQDAKTKGAPKAPATTKPANAPQGKAAVGGNAAPVAPDGKELRQQASYGYGVSFGRQLKSAVETEQRRGAQGHPRRPRRQDDADRRADPAGHADLRPPGLEAPGREEPEGGRRLPRRRTRTSRASRRCQRPAVQG